MVGRERPIWIVLKWAFTIKPKNSTWNREYKFSHVWCTCQVVSFVLPLPTVETRVCFFYFFFVPSEFSTFSATALSLLSVHFENFLPTPSTSTIVNSHPLILSLVYSHSIPTRLLSFSTQFYVIKVLHSKFPPNSAR